MRRKEAGKFKMIKDSNNTYKMYLNCKVLKKFNKN